MKWLSKHHFSDEVARMLSKGGWHPERNVEKTLTLPSDFVIFPAAKQVLVEFGNLKLGTRGPGVDRARSTVNLNPFLADGESDRFEPYAKMVDAQLYPLGEVDDGHFFVAIDEKGRIFLVMDFILFVADSFDHALDNLLLGKKPESTDQYEWKIKGIASI